MSRSFFLDEYCRTIFAVLLFNNCFDIDSGMRFNELERQLKKYGNKISTPTVINHLKELQKMKVVKRVRSGKQKVLYHITERSLDPKELGKTMTWIEKNQDIIRSWSLREIVTYTINLMSLRDFYLVKLSLKSQFESRLVHRTLIRADMINAYFRFLFNMVLETIEGKDAEYDETVKHLDSQIKTFRDVLFQRTNK